MARAVDFSKTGRVEGGEAGHAFKEVVGGTRCPGKLGNF